MMSWIFHKCTEHFCFCNVIPFVWFYLPANFISGPTYNTFLGPQESPDIKQDLDTFSDCWQFHDIGASTDLDASFYKNIVHLQKKLLYRYVMEIHFWSWKSLVKSLFKKSVYPAWSMVQYTFYLFIINDIDNSVFDWFELVIQ